MTTITDPEAPGRGPAQLGKLYRWERDDGLPLVGFFDGFVLGVRKGADTLLVGLRDGGHVAIRYEHLINAIRVSCCRSCKRFTRLKERDGTWVCSGCD